MKPGLEPLQELVAVLIAIEERLEGIERHLTEGDFHTMTVLDDLAAQVAQNTQVEASAVQLIQGLAVQVAAAAPGNLKMQALSQQLNASATALAAAILANTPSAPTTAPTPAPEPPAPTTEPST